MDQLTDLPIVFLISAVLTCLVVGFMLIWLGGAVANRYATWRKSKPRAGPSHESGDAGGHPKTEKDFGY